MILTWKQFEEAAEAISLHLLEKQKQMEKPFQIICAPARGGLCLAVKVSHLTGIKYKMGSLVGINEQVIIDDIADTGKTLSTWRKKSKSMPYIVTWFYHRESKIVPDFWLREKKNDWIVFPWEKP